MFHLLILHSFLVLSINRYYGFEITFYHTMDNLTILSISENPLSPLIGMLPISYTLVATFIIVEVFMDFINCCNTFTDSLILNTIEFWSKNSFEHIDVLLHGYEGTGAILQPSFEEALTEYDSIFHYIHETSKTLRTSKQIKELLKKFLSLNQQFLLLLQRLKFEGFNAYPILYEVVYHFIYEGQYIADLFRPLGFIVNKPNCSVIINTCYKANTYMQTNLECIYNNIYFWSIIGAEHTSILATISPIENDLPQKTKILLTEHANSFNAINYQLSTIYSRLNRNNLMNSFYEFITTNSNFLGLLENFETDDSPLLPAPLKTQLPQFFYTILTHIISEHTYIQTITYDFKKYFK